MNTFSSIHALGLFIAWRKAREQVRRKRVKLQSCNSKHWEKHAQAHARKHKTEEQKEEVVTAHGK